MSKFIPVIIALVAFIGIYPSASAQKRTAATAAAPKCAWVSFENHSDVWQVAADRTNVYVALAWTKHLAVIEKKTGKMSKITADNDIQAVVTAGDKCYYFVVTEGIFSYDPATGLTQGPLFGIEPGYDTFSQYRMSVSPDGNYILCCGTLVNLATGATAEASSGSPQALNNLGGVYFGNPEACYSPGGESGYVISGNVVVNDIFADPVTGNAYFSCEQGVGFTPEVPVENAGLTRVKSLADERVFAVNRDDAGNFIFCVDGGIAVGGKDINDPLTPFKPLDTGIKSGYVDLMVNYTSAKIILPDKSGNILIGCPASGSLVIFNPKGLMDYGSLRGKATSF